MLQYADLHKEIFQFLEQEKKTNPVSYMHFANANGKPYQCYERIGFDGLRWSVEKRISEYGLERYFDENATILDIGSNYGFFVTEFALHCKEAHGVEWVPELCEIGRVTGEALGVGDKVKFFAQPFEEFDAPCKYDTVMTLASFFTSDAKQRTTAEEFFGKINSILKDDGCLFYESTSYPLDENDKDYQHNLHAKSAVKVIEDIFDIEKVWETPSGSTFYRTFVMARKKRQD